VSLVREINLIDDLAAYRQAWGELLARTRQATFFQSLEWLEIYWRHFAAAQHLRVIVAYDDDGRPTGIVPLTVRLESTKVGRMRVLTYPLHDWGTFYGPIGPNPRQTLAAALEHVHRTPRDWDFLELRWLGQVVPCFDCNVISMAGGEHDESCSQAADAARADDTAQAMRDAGFQAYQTVYDRTYIVDLRTTWESYFAGHNRVWRRNYRHAEKKLSEQGKITFMRYRPRGVAHADADPRWDLYEACQAVARQSWQAKAVDGTTLSHESIEPFLREVHVAAAAAGALDVNLLLLDEKPLAYAYNYHWRGYVYGLRMGFDRGQSNAGAGTALLGESIRDSIARGDLVYDLGVGSPECKRGFQSCAVEIFRCSHYPPTALRTQVLRLKRWAQKRKTSIVAGRVQDGATGSR
jgi:CelD/BcsL family acetyltransferase involved in cellulose biosynthesis